MAVIALARRFLSVPLSTRFERAARDVITLLGFRPGRGPAVRARRGHDAPAHGELRLTVVDVVRETPDAVTLVFDADALTWRPGQFLSLAVPVAGGPVRRAYSISAAPGGPLQITVKRVPGGRASAWLVEQAAAGMVFSARGPSGNFTFEPRPDTPRRILLVGGGSGVTPLIAIAEAARASEPASEVHLVLGNRSAADAIFLERARALGGLELTSILEDDPADPGRLDGPRLARTLSGSWDLIYVCGPAPVMAAMRALAAERGWPTPREERFESLGEQRAKASDRPQPIEIAIGSQQLLATARPGQTVLEAGLQAGAAMPSSCTMGGCGACRVRLLRGQVVHDEPNGLSEAEREAGYIFACVARPLSPCAIEVS